MIQNHDIEIVIKSKQYNTVGFNITLCYIIYEKSFMVVMVQSFYSDGGLFYCNRMTICLLFLTPCYISAFSNADAPHLHTPCCHPVEQSPLDTSHSSGFCASKIQACTLYNALY